MRGENGELFRNPRLLATHRDQGLIKGKTTRKIKSALRVQVPRKQRFQQMNEDELLAWKRKTRQPRAEGMGVERRKRRPEEIKPARCALRAAPRPVSFSSKWTLQHRLQLPAQVRESSPPAATQQGHWHSLALRVKAAEAPTGSPATRDPTTSRGSRRRWRDTGEVDAGPRSAAAAASSFCSPSLAAPSPPSPATRSPRLTSRAASQQDSGREHQQEKQKQPWEESHGAAGPVSTRRPRELSEAPAIMALLFIRAPGGEGRGTYHVRPFATPFCVAEKRR